MYSGIGQIAVHTVNLGQVAAAALGADVHFELLVSTIVAVSQGEVYTLIKALIHGSADQGFDCLQVIVNGIFHILDLAAVA